MKKQNTIVPILLLSIGICNAQSNFGPKITAMGQNSAAVADAWSVNGNPASIAETHATTIATSYLKYLLDKELGMQAIAFILPLKNQAFGLSMQRYGISAYHEIKASGILAKKFGNRLSIALRVNFHQLKINNYGATSAFSLDVGANYKFTDQLIIGAYVDNPFDQSYNGILTKAPLPIAGYFGLCYLVSDKLLIASTVHKELGFSIDIGLGLDYSFLNIISLRSGLTIKPFKQYVGCGLHIKKLSIDIAVQSDPFFAYAPQIGIAYAF